MSTPRILSFLAACFVAGASAQAELIRVPVDAPTIGNAMERAAKGDTIRVEPGVYREQIEMKDGVNLVGENPHSVTVAVSAEEGPALTANNCTNGRIRSITFQHINPKAVGEENAPPVIDLAGSSVSVENCNVRNGSGTGILIRTGGMPWILFCHVARNRENGITVQDKDSRPFIVSTVCTQNGLNGVVFVEGAVRGFLERNVLAENDDTGLAIFPVDARIATRNNFMFDNKRYGFYIVNGSRLNSTNDDFIRNAYFNRREVHLMLIRSQFDKLEELTERLRTEKSRLDSGFWQLPQLYGHAIEFALDNERSRKSWLRHLNRWRNNVTDKVTPRVAFANMYVDLGWQARGDDWAIHVTEEGWQGLWENCEKAWQILTDARNEGLVGPELYRGALQAVVGLGARVNPSLWDDSYGTRVRSDEEYRALQQAIYEEAVEYEPYYYDMYSQRLWSLLPRWGGSPQEIADLAEDAVARTKDLDGESLYALLAGIAFSWEEPQQNFGWYDFSWPRIQQGFQDHAERYPESYFHLSRYALMAAHHQDRETTRKVLDRLGDNWSRDILGTAHRRDQIYHWAQNGGWWPIDPELTNAVSEDNLAVVKRRLEEGASVDATFRTGATVLYVAVEENKYEIAKTLLEAGADTELTWNSWTPLHKAAYDNRLPLVYLLLQFGADPDARLTDGYTPIGIAANAGHVEVVRVLLEAGADPTIPIEAGPTPLDRARSNEHTEVVKLLEAHLN